MKPLNLDNRPCSPISSNCVIWQGQDIPCINLCAGDTVSDVVYKLAIELCAIMDELKVSNYDLSCLGINSCPPSDFHALIQLLIDKVCEANGVPIAQEKSSGCPDCVVSIAPCFIEGTQTTMQLVDYVQMIANKVCAIIDQISVINNQITNIDARVTVLENTPPPTFTLPSIDTGCLATYMGNLTAAPIDQVLDTLLNNNTIGYCSLIQATGLPSDLLSAVASQCISSTDPSLAYPPDNMSTAYFGSWVNTAVTVSDAIVNLWLSICDVRTALENVGTTVVDAGANITVTSAVVGTTTTYTVSGEYGVNTFLAEGIINSTRVPYFSEIVALPPATTNGLVNGQVIIRFNAITSNNITVAAPISPGAYVANIDVPACSFGSFDNASTGEFTINSEGLYLINMSVHLKATNAGNDYWQTANSGLFGLGIINVANNLFTGQYQTCIASINNHVDVNATATIRAGVGTVIRMSILNLTDRNYDGSAYVNGDVIRFAITKLK